MRVSNKFLPLPRKNNRNSLGTIYKKNNYFSPNEFFTKLKQILSHNLSDIQTSDI